MNYKRHATNDNQTKYGMQTPQLIHGDALASLKNLPDNSIHLCVTDPPYFLKHLGDEWTADAARKNEGKRKMINSLRGGMAFDVNQGPRFQAFMADISAEIYRVLKPGGFYISFSQARLYHRLAIAVEDAGFEMRDMLAWHYQSGQPKAMSLDHFIDRRKISDDDKLALKASIGGRKTAMLKPMLEPMTLAQKPCEGTYVDNWAKHGVGLCDVSQSLDGLFPGNVMACGKPNKAERGEGNNHPTVKPTTLIEHLIRLFSTEGQTVLDPFLGSGSHGIAAVRAGRHFIGVERDEHYMSIAQSRIFGERKAA